MVYCSYLKGVLATHWLLQACILPNIKLISGCICIVCSGLMITSPLQVVNLWTGLVQVDLSCCLMLLYLHNQKRHGLDASYGFYQIDASFLLSCSSLLASSSCIKSVKIRLHSQKCHTCRLDGRLWLLLAWCMFLLKLQQVCWVYKVTSNQWISDYAARNAINLMQVMAFTGLMQVCSQVAASLMASSSCIKSVKIRLDATCSLQTCSNLLQ